MAEFGIVAMSFKGVSVQPRVGEQLDRLERDKRTRAEKGEKLEHCGVVCD